MKKEKFAVGMSGGVDSSFAAYHLLKQGYEVLGITMKVWDKNMADYSASRTSCYGPGEEESISLAGKVCDFLGIEHHVIDLKDEFRENIINYFTNEYLNGRTPNPCVMCNTKVKFGLFIDKALESGIDFDYFATGHYSNICQLENGRFAIKRPMDIKKDQTYFLGFLTQKQLARTKFPLFEFTKEEVRKKSIEANLPVAQRAESQDFMGGEYEHLFKNSNIKEGAIVDLDGKKVGTHKGIVYYTIGQRKGLIAAGKPVFVVKIDAAENKIVIGPKEALFTKEFAVKSLNLMIEETLREPTRIKAKIRQNHKESQALIIPDGKDCAKVVFDEPQISITPGQAAVFYIDDIVAGAGIIS